MKIERTTDIDFIWSVISHPQIKPVLFENDDEMAVPEHERIYYLAPYEDAFVDPGAVEKVRVGVVAFIPLNQVTWNPHIAILPQHRGKGTEAMKLGLEWMFHNTPCQKITAFPPVTNGAMVRVFEKCGMKQEGYSPRSYLQHGQLVDRFMFGMEK